MKRPRTLATRACVVAALALLLAVAAAALLVACGDTVTTTSTSPGATAASPAETPVPRTTGPGTIAFTKGKMTGPDNMIDSLGIYVVRSDGTELKELAPGGSHPAWSPDGSQIAYSMWGQGVYVMNADGSGQRLVSGGKFSVGLDWSPDGRQIIYSASAGQDVWILYVVNADGSGLRQVTTAGEPVAIDRHPVWAPDGRIYFTRWRQKPVKELPNGEIVEAEGDVPRHDICAVDPDGSGLTVVARDSMSFSLSADGRWLLVEDGDRLVRLPAGGQGKGIVVLDDVYGYALPKAFFDVASDWSPDGERIVFAADQAPWIGPSRLYIVDADGSDLKQVPHAGMGWNPAWRPQ